MRTVTQFTENAWRDAVKGGAKRGWIRATIQPMRIRSNLRYERDGVEGQFSSMMFGQSRPPREIQGIKDVSVKLDIDSGAQSCTITLWNLTHIRMTAEAEPSDAGNHERPGMYSAFRGLTDRWGYNANGWRDWLLPDRMIRLYEGYSDHIPAWNEENTPPDVDPNMYPCGVWLIDDVRYNADATITLECRDLARELIECIAYPPVVPFDTYPMEWEKARARDTITYTAGAGGWQNLTYADSSNEYFVGSGIDDGGHPYVSDGGNVRGHSPQDAFTAGLGSWWLSPGSLDGDDDSAHPWIQGSMDFGTVEAVKVHTWGGPYKVYVSVGSGWHGRRLIPYEPWRVDTAARINYVASATVARDAETVIKLPRAYQNVQAVRLTFTDLTDSHIGKYRFRAGVRSIQVAPDTAEVTTTEVNGRYSDYTDIVKWILAWGGFYWPPEASGLAYQTLSDGSKVWINPPQADPVLPPIAVDGGHSGGRVWGDFELTGTAGEEALGVDVWDKKPLLDCIRYVADIVSFSFFLDETGGAVFRSPNIWQVGNWLSSVEGGEPAGYRHGLSHLLHLADDEVLLSMSLTVSSRSRRDRIFVANNDGRFGAVANGWFVANPHSNNDPGTRRVGGWTDQHFASEEECQVMADLIAIRQRMKGGQASVTIPGYPGLQLDDQVIVSERVTSVDHRFYVSGITKVYDSSTGRYTYDLQLQWLGTVDQPFITKDDPSLAEVTQAYLAELNGAR